MRAVLLATAEPRDTCCKPGQSVQTGLLVLRQSGGPRPGSFAQELAHALMHGQ